MARFDVYRYDGNSVPLVMEVQANLFSELNTSVVVPLLPKSKAENAILNRLHPVIVVEGEEYVFVSSDIASVRRERLGEAVANVENSHRQDIVDALDFLFQGF